ncbi:hypothetical protein EGT74_12965 [Chitinophaga lutea]|uniref:F5/8 type C domain-containing protein n=1 Tax=Chitinophaga lutea TaxID=2488634 RepID=A0A3N4PGZ1_9BACT|nr:discoidin domain-containing protein [Chitinophaga lutea]RPE07982.1 hypothetical protein EGT74_12965 [Chitinophaga lutea]
MFKTVHLFFIAGLLWPDVPASAQSSPVRSSWVYPGKDGRLAYKTTPAGDRIMDFSYAGYRGGGVPLPMVAEKRRVKPSGADDTENIQAALDEVAKLPPVDGFRGAVVLAPGVFTCSGSLKIAESGVVLRGSGIKATTIRMTGGKHAAVVIDGGKRPVAMPAAPVTYLTGAYTPAGTQVINVENAAGFRTGQTIEIRKPVTDTWIRSMSMHDLVRDGKPQTWIKAGSALIMHSTVTAINGNRMTISVPLADGCDARFGKTSVQPAAPSGRITDAGVENLHIQCPPLETAYGDAPYSGIRILGDDCWVKNVYCEETMNTTVLGGDRITMQQVYVTHTHPNLGASKPTDFSIEGSCNLLDRCESTGSNTYFVWTGSLKPGPNVLLNCVFRGHGSRIQPHMRWSTGMLVDNCTVPDGGIDFLNRGVAGSGHGWTMGWAVAWNNIASTYVIQNPPGAANWAIGNTGTRQQTARLFDRSPILPEGHFESHGRSVTPQSLYLAQLAERLGPQAVKNTGYPNGNYFVRKKVQKLPPLPRTKDAVMGLNLAQFRPVNTRGNAGGEKAVDGKTATAWTVKDQQSFLELDLENPVDISAITLSEPAGAEGRILGYKVEAQTDSDWLLLSEGRHIGSKKVDTFPAVTAWKVRISVIQAKEQSAISEVGLYLR